LEHYNQLNLLQVFPLETSGEFQREINQGFYYKGLPQYHVI